MSEIVRCEVSAEDHLWCLTHECKVTDPQHPKDFDGYVRHTIHVRVQEVRDDG